LLWPILAALSHQAYGIAAVCFAIAGVSDLLDGWLAKRFGWTSELGKWLDPVADKFLLVTVFVVAAWAGLVPRWLTAVVVARDVMIALGALAYFAWLGNLQGRPTFASKLNTLVQLAYLFGVLTYKAIGFRRYSAVAGDHAHAGHLGAVGPWVCDRVFAAARPRCRHRDASTAAGTASCGRAVFDTFLAARQ